LLFSNGSAPSLVLGDLGVDLGSGVSRISVDRRGDVATRASNVDEGGVVMFRPLLDLWL
jgi:hypothetical protein